MLTTEFTSMRYRHVDPFSRLLNNPITLIKKSKKYSITKTMNSNVTKPLAFKLRRVADWVRFLLRV